MRYFGSKAATADAVEVRARELLGRSSAAATMCDPFGGIGVVASSFKRGGWKVTSADHLLFPHMYQRARLEVSAVPAFDALLRHLKVSDPLDVANHLQSLPGQSGWLTEQFAKERRFFSPSNARQMDAVWAEINAWHGADLITEHEFAFLTSSLIESFDRVANTAGTYYAFLKSTTRRAAHAFQFRFIDPVPGVFDATCIQSDALETVASGRFDVIYLDPPYSCRSYDRYYHLPQSVATGASATAVGMSGVPSRPPIPSRFESPRTADTAICNLVDAANCSLIMLQYADGGLLSLARLREILASRGPVSEVALTTIGYTTQKHSRACQHTLFSVALA